MSTSGYDQAGEMEVVDKKPEPDAGTVVVLPRRMPRSLHEARVINNSIRIEAGRYRVLSPPPFVAAGHSSHHHLNHHQQHHFIGSPRIGVDPRPAPRRPVKAIGDGQLLGKSSVPETSFAKIVEIMPSKQRKRVYFNDDDDDAEEMVSPKKPLRLIKRTYKKYDDVNMPSSSLSMPKVDNSMIGLSSEQVHHDDVQDHDVGVNSQNHHDSRKMSEMVHHDQSQDSHVEYGEEVVDVIEEVHEHDGSVTGYMPSYERQTVSVPRLHSLGIGNVTLVKQLRGENNYLRDQLDASFYRIKQLEALLLERNQRLKQLLTENVQLGVKVRKLSTAMGEQTAQDVLTQNNNPSRRMRK